MFAIADHVTPKIDEGGVAFTLNSRDYKMPQAVAIENHPADSRVRISTDGMVQTLSSRMGTGGGNVPMVMEGGDDLMEVSEEYIVRRLTPL